MKGTGRAIATGAFVVALAAILLARMHATAANVVAELNSDELYLVALYNDVFVHHRSLSTWVLQPAPSFFPDMPLFFVALRTMPNAAWAFALYFAAMLAVLVAVMALITRTIDSRSTGRGALLVQTASGAMLVTLVEDRGPLRTLFLPNFHGAALVMGLALLLIALRAYQAQTWQWSARLLFVLIGVLTCFSDLIIAPQTLAPLCVAVLAAWCAGTASTRFSVQSLVLIVATTALGVFMAKHPPHLFIPAPAPPRFAYDRLGEGLRLFLNSDHANGHVVMLLGAVVSITLAIAALFRSWRADDPSDAAARAPLVIAVAYLISSIAASLLTGTATWVDEWSSRYFYLVYVLPVLLSPIWLCCLLRRHASTVNAVWVVLAVLMGGFNIAATLKRSTQEHLAMPYPQWLACLDDIAEQRHIQFGYGDYWDAKYASVLSHRGLIVNQLTPSYERYYWINNVDWYPNKIDGSFFLLPDHLPDPEPRLGHPTATLRCADRQVFIYDGASAAKLPRTGSGPR